MCYAAIDGNKLHDYIEDRDYRELAIDFGQFYDIFKRVVELGKMVEFNEDPSSEIQSLAHECMELVELFSSLEEE